MIAGIMQPYFFPYFGYFQLINAVDHFIIHDDVQYIKGGWIARNRLSKNGAPEYFRLAVSKAPHDTEIRQMQAADPAGDLKKLYGQFQSFYARAPHRQQVLDLVSDGPQTTALGDINLHFLRRVCDLLEIETPITLASEMDVAPGLAGKDKVIALVKAAGADKYVNPVGGKSLYRRDDFDAAGLRLAFLSMAPDGTLDGWSERLSVLDLLARNELHEMRAALDSFVLEPSE